jgi:hypothetical protein
MSYGLANLANGIWKGQPWSMVTKEAIDDAWPAFGVCWPVSGFSAVSARRAAFVLAVRLRLRSGQPYSARKGFLAGDTCRISCTTISRKSTKPWIALAIITGITDHIWSLEEIAMPMNAVYAPKKRGPLRDEN